MKNIDIFAPNICFPIIYCILYATGAIYLFIREEEFYLETILYALVGIVFYRFGLLTFFKQKYFFSKIINNWKEFNIKIILTGITATSILSALYIYMKIGIPILSEDLFQTRHYDFERVSHYSLYLLRNIGLALHYGFIFFILKQKENNRYKSLFLIILIFTSFLLMISTAGRADLFFTIIPLIINYHYIIQNISLKRGAVLFVALIFIIIGYNYYRLFTHSGNHETLVFLKYYVGDDHIKMFLFHLIAQMSLVGTCFADVLEYIPSSVPYFHGSLIPQTLSTFLPGHQSPPGEILKLYSGLSFTGGQSNLTLLGDFYSDFGVFCIPFGMYTLAIILNYFYYRLNNYKNASSLILYNYILYSSIVGIPGGLFSQAIRYYYFILIIIMNLLISRRK